MIGGGATPHWQCCAIAFRFSVAIRPLWIALACVVGYFGPVIATASAGTFGVQVENDIFGEGTDEHYSHGSRLSYLTDDLPADSWQRRIADWLPFAQRGQEARASFALGQSIFTPVDLSNPNLILNDRPYAGWLYASYGFVLGPRRSETLSRLASTKIDRLDTFEISLGVVGPASQAEEVQKFIHKLIGAEDPKSRSRKLLNRMNRL